MSCKVIAVDDSEDLLRLIETALTRYGCEIIQVFESVSSAMYGKWEDAEVALIDYMLPGDNGDVLATWLKNNHPHIKTICLTAMPVDQVSDVFDVVYNKPYSVKDLVKTIERLSHSHHDQ